MPYAARVIIDQFVILRKIKDLVKLFRSHLEFDLRFTRFLSCEYGVKVGCHYFAITLSLLCHQFVNSRSSYQHGVNMGGENWSFVNLVVHLTCL